MSIKVTELDVLSVDKVLSVDEVLSVEELDAVLSDCELLESVLLVLPDDEVNVLAVERVDGVLTVDAELLERVDGELTDSRADDILLGVLRVCDEVSVLSD